MVTIHIDRDGQPVETTETEHAPCVVADPNAAVNAAYTRWTQAPRSYRATFVENASAVRSDAEAGLLPDLRGPPPVI